MPSAPLGIVASHDHFKEATGGTITYSGGYTIHTFTSSGTFTIGAKGCREIEWEIIGGGGGGGEGVLGKYVSTLGAGGGGGGYITGIGQLSPYWSGSAPVTAIPVTVGAGGSGNGPGPVGTASKFRRDNLTTPDWNGLKTGASGGNGTGINPANDWGIATGYSGSGRGQSNSGFDIPGEAFAPNGNTGGTAGGTAGGGGGAGGIGGSGTNATINNVVYYDAGDGGAGISGCAGGGGGAAIPDTSGYVYTAGTGIDGGGNGSKTGTGSNGAANTGGGGGGSTYSGLAQDTTRAGGNGGSGKVIIKYKTV